MQPISGGSRPALGGSFGRPADNMLAVLIPPEVQVIEGSGAIRWAVGSPDGLRSRSWTVVGEKSGDVYIAPRMGMKDLKLSLHPAKWRMALTKEAAATRLPAGEDRVISRWEHTDECALGWRLGATITVPHCSLVASFGERRLNLVRWFPTPGAGRSLRFVVLIGAPDRETLTVKDHIGDVGRISLATGGAVWVIAYEDEFDEAREAEFRLIQRRAVETSTEEIHGFAWGCNDDDGSPAMIELGNVGPTASKVT